MNPRDAKDLLQLFNRGDHAAFEYIYNKLSAGIFDFIKKILGNHEDAEDVLAETFFKLWTIPKNFENIQNINAFLHVTSRNACFDRLRHTRMELAKRQIVLDNILRSYDDNNDDREITEQLLHRIYKEMEKLPAKSRDVFKLSFIEDLKNAEIARRLGTNEKTIRNQKASALKRLRLTILQKFKDKPSR